MNAEELSLIGPVVDLANVDAIHRKRLVAFVNHFLINTANFLNRLVKSCDSKLLQIQLKLQKLEASIILIESKLTSIPGLDSPVVAEQPPPPKLESSVENTPVSPVKNEEEGKKEETESSNAQTLELDPSLLRFVKMLKVKVPVPAVRSKMTQEGISEEMQSLVFSQFSSSG